MKRILFFILTLALSYQIVCMEYPEQFVSKHYESSSESDTDKLSDTENKQEEVMITIETKYGRRFDNIPLRCFQHSETINNLFEYSRGITDKTDTTLDPIFLGNITAQEFITLLPLLEIISNPTPQTSNHEQNNLLKQLNAYTIPTLCSLINACNYLDIELLLDPLLLVLAEKIISSHGLMQFTQESTSYIQLLSTLPTHFHEYLIQSLIDEDILSYFIPQPSNSITLLDAAEWQCSARFNHTGDHIISTSNDNIIRVWNCKTGELTRTFFDPSHCPPDCYNKEFSVCISPDDAYIASGSCEKKVRLWETSTKKLLHTFEGHTAGIHGICFSPNNTYVASSDHNKTINIWNINTKNLVHTIKSTGWIYKTCFSPDGNYLAYISDDRLPTNAYYFKIYDTRTFQLVYERKHDEIHTISFSPNSSLVITVSTSKKAKVWNSHDGTKRYTLKHDSSIRSACFSNNNKYIATASSDHTVKIWQAHHGDLLHVLRHNDTVSSVCFSYDNKYIASASSDHTIKIWQLNTGKCIHTITHNNRIESLCFSPNGNYLACKLVYGSIKLWDITPLNTSFPPLTLPQLLLIHALEKKITDWETIKEDNNLKKIFKSFLPHIQKQYKQGHTLFSTFKKLLPALKKMSITVPAYLYRFHHYNSNYSYQRARSHSM